MKPQKLLSLILLTSIAMALTACVGSDKPRKPIRQIERSPVYVPPINPELLLPSSLKKSNLDFYKQRAALQASLKNPHTNPWRAADRDIEHLDRIIKGKR